MISTAALFLYNFISLYISSAVSIRLKGVQNVEKIVYINNISLLLTVALLSMALSSMFALKYGCSTSLSSANYNTYSLVASIFLNLFLNSTYIAMISNAQFKNTPVEIQRMLIVALVLNLIGTLAGIVFAIKSTRYKYSSYLSL